jgi:ligand-binding SRPBCC domain-containing protein
MPKIKLELVINAPKTLVFDLSRSIDLHKISTKQTNEEAIAGVTYGLIDKDKSVTWRAKHFGIYQDLTSKITEFEMPNYFVDEMEKGIFKRFRHEHIFKDFDDKTLMVDIFDYESPLGILGKIADKLFLEKYIKSLLEIRNATIKEFAESGKWREVLN